MVPPETENPALLRLHRGREVEAFHRGAFVVVREGRVVAAAGDPRMPCFLRSGAKSFQALVHVLSGAHERFGLSQRHLALMCASHGGEPEHVQVAQEMLARGGLTVEHLQCGAHPPLHGASAAALRAQGAKPTALHNNCSGKHAGMLLTCLALGEPTESYLDANHPLQVRIREMVARLAEVEPDTVRTYVDGCSAPTFVIPLEAAARAFHDYARPPESLGQEVRAGAALLQAAVAAEPFMVAGHGRFCTDLARVSRGRVMGKVGAEGFYGIYAPHAAVGIALHVDDGAWKASEHVTTVLLHRLGLLDDAELEALSAYAPPIRKNHRGLEVGKNKVLLPGLDEPID